MNRKKIRKLRNHLAATSPERFDMGHWGSVIEMAQYGGEEHITYQENPTDKDVGLECGTAACLAGLAIALFGPGLRIRDNGGDTEFTDKDGVPIVPSGVGGRILGLETAAERSGLFGAQNWPEPYSTMYRDAEDREDRKAARDVAVFLLDAVLAKTVVWSAMYERWLPVEEVHENEREQHGLPPLLVVDDEPVST